MTWVSQQVLATLAANPDGLARESIERAGGVRGRSLENALLKLRRLAFVALDDGLYSITAAGKVFLAGGRKLTSGPRGPQPGRRLFKGTLRERAWRAMRIRKKFSLLEIVPLAATGNERDAENNIGKYVRALARTGFLSELKSRARGEALTSNGFKRYLLTRDTGLQAPRWLPRRGVVYDPNTEEEHPL